MNVNGSFRCVAGANANIPNHFLDIFIFVKCEFILFFWFAVARDAFICQCFFFFLAVFFSFMAGFVCLFGAFALNRVFLDMPP